MEVHVRFAILGLLNMLLVTFIFLLIHQERGLNGESLSSTTERCTQLGQRKLAACSPPSPMNNELNEDDETPGTSSASNNPGHGKGNYMNEHNSMNNKKGNNAKNANAINYVYNDIEDTYELPDYNMIKENERRLKEDYDLSSYEKNENEFLRHISEGEVNERIKKLGEYVNVKEMFIIWNYINGFERAKYINMEKNMIQHCEDLSSTYNVSKKTKTKLWTTIYYYMKDEMFYQERKLHKALYNFLDQGPSPKGLFLEFIDQTIRSWRDFRRGVNKICMAMLNSTVKGDSSGGVSLQRDGVA
ncbi:hypothetical protein AK88_04175 [Plasmodium fragile]|uniref:Plasmodium RESA N-terminal domain-containing protein n=1 Tax=Plasmodium fragile TaxID=5857 RepID=A0A0D9QGS5_PLAFR|nr:uncharacterized protein AK88_04175 [Plasmodium fragile]KJP86204.1 hypothetical protein AK88_04175 [Plasmodium fragile]